MPNSKYGFDVKEMQTWMLASVETTTISFN